MKVTRGDMGGVILERTIDGDGLRPDWQQFWNLTETEWATIRDFALLELRA